MKYYLIRCQYYLIRSRSLKITVLDSTDNYHTDLAMKVLQNKMFYRKKSDLG